MRNPSKQVAPAPVDAFAIARELLLEGQGLELAALERALSVAMVRKLDYVDLYLQLTRYETWTVEDGIVKEGAYSVDQGIGVRAVSGEPTVKAGPLTIDLAARAVLLNDKRLTLTPKEYRLLQVLAQHAGNVVTHQHLLKEVWGSIHVHDTHYLRIFVRKLRQKIEPHPDTPKILVTELGVGSRLVQSGAEGETGAWSDSAQVRSET